MTCQHADFPLADPLEPRIVAALRLPVDTADRADALTLAQRVMWTLRITAVLDRKAAYADGPDAACAVMRQHPGLARYGDRGPGGITPELCRWADLYWDATPDRTDMGLAERVAIVHGDVLKYSGAAVHMVWDDARWRADDTGAAAAGHVKSVVRRLLAREAEVAQNIADALAARSSPPPPTDEADHGGKRRKKGAEVDPDVARAERAAAAARAYATKCQSARAIRAGLELYRSEPGALVPADQWDAHPELLTLANGTVELTDGGTRLREHRREDRLTRVARAAHLPSADRSAWCRFVADVLPDPAVRERAQRLAGYSLFGGNRERLLVILLGPTTTGKSTFVETIAHVLGDYGGPFELSMFRGTRDGGAHRADLVAALPRRFVQTTEASDRWQIHADAIKRITGGDTLAPRGAYACTAVEQQPQFVPWLATNSAPQVVGADDALWRRLEVLPFTAKIAHEDPGLALRLRTDGADAVLGWLLDGWEQYARHGLGAVPTACRVAAAQLRRDLSLVDTWLDECTKPDPDAVEPVQAFGESWQAWCGEQHVPTAELISNVALARELTARGHPATHIGTPRQRVRPGLRLIDQHAQGLRAVQ